MPFSTSLPWDVIWSPPWIMLLIFPSNFAIGFSALRTIYRSFFFSCSPLGNQKWATVIRLLFLRSWSKPDTSSFLILSTLSPVAVVYKARPSCSTCAVMILVMLRWCDAKFALGEIFFAELMKLILPPPCIQESHGGLCDLFCLLSLRCSFQRASVWDCPLNLHIWSIRKALGSHCPLVPQERHPKALDNV